METTDKKRKYVKPATKMYELRGMPQLLQTSGTRNPYGNPTNWNWD